MRVRVKIAVCLLVVFQICFLSIIVADQKPPQPRNLGVPGGHWSIGVFPFLKSTYMSDAVVIRSVRYEVSKGGIVSAVQVNNRSKDIVAMNLIWYLSSEERPGVVLAKGELPLLNVSIPSGRLQTIDFQPLSFAEIYKRVLKNGTLEGNYRIDVGVATVTFNDGSGWTPENTDRLVYMSVSPEIQKASIGFIETAYAQDCLHRSCRQRNPCFYCGGICSPDDPCWQPPLYCDTTTSQVNCDTDGRTYCNVTYCGP